MILMFWLAALFVGYTYVGYPLLVWLLSRVRPAAQVSPAPAVWPPVSVIVPFCRERQRVLPKLETLRAQDYAGEMQIIFVSDGEEDDTANAIRALQSQDVTAVVLPQRSGKPTALNAGMQVARHDLILFTDARQMLDTHAVTALVQRLQDPDIAAVSGELMLRDEQDQERIGLYWRYEKFIRKAESRLSSVPGVTGAIYMMRREWLLPLPEDTLLDDFDMPLHALRHGKRVVFESAALAFDQAAEDVAREKIRKVRTLTGNFQSFFRHRWLFSPRANPIWWQFMSHKVARLMVPYALLVLLLAPLFAGSALLLALFSLQVGFYLLAAGKRQGWPACDGAHGAFALLFVELNLAAVQAAWAFLSQPADARWERTA